MLGNNRSQDHNTFKCKWILCSQSNTFSSCICKAHAHSLVSTTVKPRRDWSIVWNAVYQAHRNTTHTRRYSHLTRLTSLGRGNTPRSYCLGVTDSLFQGARHILHLQIVTHIERQDEAPNMLTTTLSCDRGSSFVLEEIEQFYSCSVAQELRWQHTVQAKTCWKAAALKEAFTGQQISAI